MSGPDKVKPAELLEQARARMAGERTEALRLAGEALAAARAERDLSAAAQALNFLADASRVAGDTSEASRLAEEALATAREARDERAQAAATNLLSALAWHRGELARAVELSRQVLALREKLGDERGVAASCSNLSLLYTERGDLVQAMEFHQRCLGLREKLNDHKGLGIAYLNLGVIYAELGDWDKALESYFRALAEKERLGDNADAALCCSNIAEVYLGRGKLDRARFYLDRALELAEKAEARWVRAEVLGTMGDVALAAGDLSLAMTLYEQDKALCTEIGERKELAESLRRVAEVHLARGEPDECRARLEEALRLCSDAGLRREEGNVHRVLGELAAATGDMPGASAEFDRSEEILKAVGRNYELGKALLAMAKCECRMAVERRREKLEEARAIFENLGATALAAEAGAVRDSLIAPVPTADLLSGLTELTLWGLGSAEFARRGLEFITGKLGIPGGAVFLRDGRVFRAGGSEDGGDRKDEPKSGGVSFALEAAGRRLGTLVVYGGVDIGRVKTAVDLFALGLAQAGQTPAPAESGKGKGPRRERIERFPGVVGAETTLKTVFDTVERVAPTKANVLILGESGTGKEIVARALHQRSDRRDKKFIAVNCAAIPEPLLESELLGVEKGTATGVSGRAGKFEQADGGTLFLDEIGDMSLALQAKMLRVLQERSFEKVGGREPISVDVRVVAATNRDLEQAMTEGKFRRDLFFRLNVISLALPPLRERRRDIPSLVDLFIGRVAREYGKPVRGATDDCLACLRAAAWPGNVRELENVIERAVILAAGPYVTVEDLPPAMQGRAAAQTGWRDARKKAEDEAGAEVEESTVVAALEQCGWVVSKAARRLGVSRRHLYRIMERRGIKKPRE